MKLTPNLSETNYAQNMHKKFTNNAQIPITNKILNTAEPTIVPMPTSVSATNTPFIFI